MKLSAASAKEIALLVSAAGFPVLRTSEADDMADGEVEITPLVQIQVGENGMCNTVVSDAQGEEFSFGAIRTDSVSLLNDLRKVMPQCDPGTSITRRASS